MDKISHVWVQTIIFDRCFCNVARTYFLFDNMCSSYVADLLHLIHMSKVWHQTIWWLDATTELENVLIQICPILHLRLELYPIEDFLFAYDILQIQNMWVWMATMNIFMKAELSGQGTPSGVPWPYTNSAQLSKYCSVHALHKALMANIMELRILFIPTAWKVQRDSKATERWRPSHGLVVGL